jgi:hypothetical protein
MFKTVEGLDEIASEEISERIHGKEVVVGQSGRSGWISCQIGDFILENVRTLSSAVIAQILFYEEKCRGIFSTDAFGCRVIESISSCAP